MMTTLPAGAVRTCWLAGGDSAKAGLSSSSWYCRWLPERSSTVAETDGKAAALAPSSVAKGRRGHGSLIAAALVWVCCRWALARHDGQPAGLLVESVEVDEGVKAVRERPEGRQRLGDPPDVVVPRGRVCVLLLLRGPRDPRLCPHGSRHGRAALAS